MAQGRKFPVSFWNKTFLETLKDCMGNVLLTCRTLNISPPSYYNHRLRNPAFARRATQIIDNVCVPVLEDIAFTRAVKGNDKLLMFLLRSRGGKRWNQDLLEAAFAKLTAKWEHEKNNQVIPPEEQRPPTKAEKAAAKAYLDNLEEDDADFE